MPYVVRALGVVTGCFEYLQPGRAEEFLPETDPEVVAYRTSAPSADPTAVQQMVFGENMSTVPANTVMKWTGTKFVPVSLISTLRKTADQVINRTAFIDVDDLSFPVEANLDYAFDFYIGFRSSIAATGFRFSLNGPAASAVSYLTKYQTVNNASGLATWLERHDIAYETMPTLNSTVAANTDLLCRITGKVSVGIASGNLSVRAASEVANNSLTVRKGSWGIWF